MLSIAEAREAVLAEVRPLPAQDVALGDALGRVLAAPVISPHPVPPFDNSAMDGFAVRAGEAGRRLPVVGESRAGAPYGRELGDGEAVRISTGAALPAGAEGVLQIELVQDDGDTVVLEDAVTPGRNVRRAGEDVAAGATVLGPGTVLDPAALGVAANAGAATLSVARRPRVAILGTGDELVPPGQALGPGQIHDSNTTTLAALARLEGAEVVLARTVPDERAATEEAIAAALAAADVVLLSGGVSVGPHDHVKPALLSCGVRERFWRVALRPGKPTWFGAAHDATLVLGLPGNPVSTLVTFVLFARPALRALQGAAPLPRPGRAQLAVDVERHEARDECVRVRIDDEGRAAPTGPQGSHVLTSVLGADALAVVPRGSGVLPAGTPVELLPLRAAA